MADEKIPDDHRRKAREALEAFLDASDASQQTALNTSKELISDLTQRITQLERNSAEERQLDSERILRLEESVKDLQDARARTAEREHSQARSREAHTSGRFVDAEERTLIRGELARSREEIMRLQEQMAKLQRENEDLRNSKRIENRDVPAPSRQTLQLQRTPETTVGGSNINANGTTESEKIRTVQLEIAKPNEPAEVKAEAASYPSPRSPEGPLVSRPSGSKDAPTTVENTASTSRQQEHRTPLPTPPHSNTLKTEPTGTGKEPEGSHDKDDGQPTKGLVQSNASTQGARIRKASGSPVPRAPMRIHEPTSDVIDLTKEDEGIPSVLEQKPVVNSVEAPVGDLSSRLAHFKFPPYQLNVDEDILEYRCSRRNISRCIGGSEQGTFPPVGKEMKKKHGYDRFMCQDRDYNEYAPTAPGAHGSHFACRDKKQWPHTDGKVECVIVKEMKNVWGVYGLYKCERSTPLTGEDFKRLEQKVQDTWIDGACNKSVDRPTAWAPFTLAAILLRHERRQNGDLREPSDKDIESCIDQYKGRSAPHRLCDIVTREQVQNAFESGEERLNVFSMRCVGFDTDLAVRLMPNRAPAAGQINKQLQDEGKEVEAVDEMKAGGQIPGRKRKRCRTPDSLDGPHTAGAKRRVLANHSVRLDNAKEKHESVDEERIPDSDEGGSGSDEDDGQSDYNPGLFSGVGDSSTRPRRSTRK